MVIDSERTNMFVLHWDSGTETQHRQSFVADTVLLPTDPPCVFIAVLLCFTPAAEVVMQWHY